jgi:ankyrin repeat protein
MKHLLLTTIAAVVLVGCGESQSPEPPDIPIHQAVAQRNIEAVKQHLDAGTDVNSRAGLNQTPLDYTEKISLKTAKKEIADLLRKCGGKHSSIYEAAKGGDLEGIKEFLAAGVDPDEKTGITFDLTPLSIASTKEVAELLIDKGADVNAIPKSGLFGTSLDYAIRNKHPEIADLLRKHGGKRGDWFKAGESIFTAAKAGHIEAVKQHLAAGADVNAKTMRGETPLDWAIKRKHTETADLLRKHGGKTGEELVAEESIHAAARYGNIEAIKQHLAAGTDVDANNVGGVTPLHWAAQEGQKEIAELLIAKGASVNAQDVGGYTPLDSAIRWNYTETADLLRKHGGKTKKELEAEGK